MEKYVALLRGINVTGQKKVPMAALRELLGTQVKLERVKTYIQTGNVVFEYAVKDPKKIETLIHEAIKKHFGFEVPILVVNHLALQDILNACPFSKEKKEKSYFTLLKLPPEKQLIEAFMALEIVNEEIVATNKCVYFFSSEGYGKAKCNTNFIEKRLKVNATTRNYKTLVKLIEMAG